MKMGIGKNMESGGGGDDERISQIIGLGLGYVGLEKVKICNWGDGTETRAWDRELGFGIKKSCVKGDPHFHPPCHSSFHTGGGSKGPFSVAPAQ